MQSLRLISRPDGGFGTEILPLRMPQASGVVDPEPFRARARGEGDPLAEPYALSGGMRVLHAPDGGSVPLCTASGALLTFVISGSLEVGGVAGGAAPFAPGDIFLLEGDAPRDTMAVGQGDCRLVQLAVEADWPGARARPPRPGSTQPRGALPCNIKRMIKGADDKSYFHRFDTLFKPDSKWSDFRPIIGFRFIGMAADTFIDWHPEIVNNFVILLSGALELEVGGGEGAVEIFREGDICLAQDRTGEGHIDRVHGHVQVAVLILEDENLWP